VENLKAGERLSEALALAEADDNAAAEYQKAVAAKLASAVGKQPAMAPRPTNPLLLGLSASAYLLRTLRQIPSADVEEALMVIPFTSMLSLFRYFDIWLRDGIQIELTTRCLYFALRMYNNQLTGTRMRSHAGLLESLVQHTRGRLQQEKDAIGFNIAGLKHIQQEMQDDGVRFFDAEETITAARTRGSMPREKRKRLV
jgi:U3 small nucleolar RNA-associated protein 12